MEYHFVSKRGRLPARIAWLMVLAAAAISASNNQIPTALNIVVLQGEGAINNVREHDARPTVVRIEDQDRHPIVGAAVLFALPTEGATGKFANGTITATVMTDSQGVATTPGVRINGAPGKLVIYVNASYRGQAARTTVTQFNMVVPKGKKQS